MKGRLGARLNRLRLNAGQRSQAAILGSRLRAFRLGAVTPKQRLMRAYRLYATLNDQPVRIRRDSLTIHDALHDEPNTCSLTIDPATAPIIGARLRIVIGSAPQYTLFVGSLTTVTETYEGKPANRVYQCTACDDTPRADRRVPLGAWVDVSATDVAQLLVAQYVPGYSSAGVAAGLPNCTLLLDGRTTINNAMRDIAKQIGGHFYWEDRTLYLFTTSDAADAPDDILPTPRGRLLDTPAVNAASDDSQLRTRVYGKGHGERVLSDIPASATVIPIASAEMFNPLGGKAITDAQQAAAPGTRANNPAVRDFRPTLPPTVVQAAGSGIAAGVYQYAYTWVTASAESDLSPLATVRVVGTPVAPAITLIESTNPGNGPAAGTQLRYALVLFDNSGTATESAAGPITTITSDGANKWIHFSVTADCRGFTVTLYRSENGGPWRIISTAFADIGATYPLGADVQLLDHVLTAGGAGVTTPGKGDLVANRVRISGIPRGPAQVIAAKIYRTYAEGSAARIAAGGSYLRYVGSVAPDGAYTDSTPDGSLGAAWTPAVEGNGNASISAGQVISYTGTVVNPSDASTGTLIGPGVAPTMQCNVAPTYGSGIADGTYQYAYSWVTASGETRPSPTKAITIAGAKQAPAISSFTPTNPGNGVTAGTQLRYCVKLFDNGGSGAESLGGPISTITSDGWNRYANVTITADCRGFTLILCRSDMGGPWYDISTGFADIGPNAPIGSNVQLYDHVLSSGGPGNLQPGKGTLVANRVIVSSIPPGQSPQVTSRKIYRTTAGGSQLRLVGSTGTDTYTDSTPDASLGANAPTGDTSNLQQPTGVVLPGATAIPVSSTAWANAAGGFVQIGSQFVRYTGFSNGQLTGVPASGDGSLINAVAYNTAIASVDALIGVSGLRLPLAKGANVHIWVQVDDPAAQAELAARDGSDGVIEHVLTDDARGEGSMRLLCQADLALYSRPIVTVRYACRDVKTRSGKTVRVQLPSLGVDATLWIQSVDISEIDAAPGLPPRYSVTASSVRFTLDDMLRRLVEG